MRGILLAVLLLASVPAYAVMGWLIDEQEDGLNRICIYETVTGNYAITVPIQELCPVTIQTEEDDNNGKKDLFRH